ncbi:hypothetical protein GQ42DRAFT_5236 [Ramicandelaber brevisporus]|nr:hypothetical protein GQ42DRAFT_5236 [Ramicandelaber brevisporus]
MFSAFPFEDTAGASAAANTGTGSLLPHAAADDSAAAATEDNSRKRTRPTYEKLNASKLRGTDGFPRLVQDVSRIRLRSGRGGEATDLRRVLAACEAWAHNLYPRLSYHDFVYRAERVCTERSMHLSLANMMDKDKFNAEKAAIAEVNDALNEVTAGTRVEEETGGSNNNAGPAWPRFDDDNDEHMWMGQEETSLGSMVMEAARASEPLAEDIAQQIEERRQQALAKLAERKRQRQMELELELELEQQMHNNE